MRYAAASGVWLAEAPEPVIDRLRVARRFLQRAVGLLGKAGLAPREALLIPNCRSLHTFGMRFAIDVLFVDDQGVVRDLFPQTPSGHIVIARSKPVHALEVSAGFIAKHNINPGQRLSIR